MFKMLNTMRRDSVGEGRPDDDDQAHPLNPLASVGLTGVSIR